MADVQKKGVLVPVVLAGAITLVVTLVRLLGEVNDWDARFFSKEPGGAGAIVGIGWLVIPVGFWLGRVVARSSGRPAMGKAFGLTLLAIALFAAGVFTVGKVWPKDFEAMFTYMTIATPTLSLLCLLAWPRAFFANLGYAVMARGAVIGVQYYAIARAWGTHFERVGPQLGELAPEARAHVLMLSQVAFWTPFTVITCGLFALFGALTVRKQD